MLVNGSVRQIGDRNKEQRKTEMQRKQKKGKRDPELRS